MTFRDKQVYEYLEAEGFLYAIRLPANTVLQESIAHLLTRPVGWPPNSQETTSSSNPVGRNFLGCV